MSVVKNGVYVIWLRLAQTSRIQVGALGFFAFPQGYYAYAGSAQTALQARLARHAKACKPLRWHIDYLSAKAQFLGAAAATEGKAAECELARELANLPGAKAIVPRFGASDCSCLTHLWFFSELPAACGEPALLRPSLLSQLVK